jgi:hypothetical protein
MVEQDMRTYLLGEVGRVVVVQTQAVVLGRLGSMNVSGENFSLQLTCPFLFGFRGLFILLNVELP